MIDLLTTLSFTSLAFMLGYLIGKWNHTTVQVDNYVLLHHRRKSVDGEEWKEGYVDET